MSYHSKCMATKTVEDIVQSYKMINCRVADKGLLDLAYRSGEVTIIQAHAVHENDVFEYELGLEPKLVHKPAMDNRGNAIAYYAMFKTKNGGNGFQVMSIEQIREHAKKYSKSYGSSYSPWTTDFDSMAKKTVLKATLKYCPLKTEFVKGLNADETIKSNINADMADEHDETDYIEVETVQEENSEETQQDMQESNNIVAE